MEKITSNFMKFFYALMVVIHTQLIAKNITCDPVLITMDIMAACNLVLYGVALLVNIKKKYMQEKWLLSVLVVTTVLLYIPMTINETGIHDASYVVLNASILHVLLEWAIIKRIVIIKRLEVLSTKGAGNGR